MTQTEATATEAAVAERTSAEIVDMRVAARFLGMGYGYLNGLRKQGKGPTPTFMVGTRPRWSIEALRAWVRDQDAKRDQEAKKERRR